MKRQTIFFAFLFSLLWHLVKHDKITVFTRGEMSVYYIIVNPKAGNGQSVLRAASLESRLKLNNIEFSTVFTTGEDCGYNQAYGFCKNLHPKSSGIVGIGGDGTLQEIVAGMSDAFPRGEKIPIPLCILPAGSGNDFVLSVVRSKGNPFETFIGNLLAGNRKTVDIITANNRAFLNIGNVGLDAWIVKNAEDKKKKYGNRAYVAAVYKSIKSYKPINLKIEANGMVLEGAFTLVAVSNGQYYGGGLHISPGAQIDDGKITLCVVEAMSKLKTFAIFPTLIIKKHVYMKAVKFYECTSVKITFSDGTGTLCLDGNLSQSNGSVEFNIYPQVLDIIV